MALIRSWVMVGTIYKAIVYRRYSLVIWVMRGTLRDEYFDLGYMICHTRQLLVFSGIDMEFHLKRTDLRVHADIMLYCFWALVSHDAIWHSVLFKFKNLTLFTQIDLSTSFLYRNSELNMILCTAEIKLLRLPYTVMVHLSPVPQMR